MRTSEQLIRVFPNVRTESSLDGSLFLQRIFPTEALQIVPRTGHTITVEEPEIINAALDGFFAAATEGNWMIHKRTDA